MLEHDRCEIQTLTEKETVRHSRHLRGETAALVANKFYCVLLFCFRGLRQVPRTNIY